MTLPRPTADALDDIAADWAARLDARALTTEEQAELSAWLDSDPRCLGAFARARAVLLGGGAIAARQQPVMSRRALLWGGGAMAAGIGGAVIATHPPAPGRSQKFESLLGEIRHIPLDDGSHITLNTASALSVEFTPARRLIRLLRGEAFFEVADNPSRPFIVQSAVAQMRSIGAACGIRLTDPQTMTVAVTLGQVAIENSPSRLMSSLQALTGGWPNLDEDLSPVAVMAGHEATVHLPPSGKMMISIEAVAADTLARGLEWREGQLAFEGTSLAEAAAEFARYSSHRVVIADRDLAQRHISGLFAVTDPEGFAKAAALSLGANTRHQNDSIVLYR